GVGSRLRVGRRGAPRFARHASGADAAAVTCLRATSHRSGFMLRGRGSPLTLAQLKKDQGNAMLGLMQDWPLLCHRIIDHAAANHAERPIVTRSVEGPIHTTNYAQVRARALRLAQRLDRDGIGLGDRVATLAWSTWRHLEAW